MQAVRQRGAVIEAAASTSLGSPTVSLLIEPTGAVRVVATMDQLFGARYRSTGHAFPQCTVVHGAIVDAATAVSKQLVAAGYVGVQPVSSESSLGHLIACCFVLVGSGNVMLLLML